MCQTQPHKSAHHPWIDLYTESRPSNASASPVFALLGTVVRGGGRLRVTDGSAFRTITLSPTTYHRRMVQGPLLNNSPNVEFLSPSDDTDIPDDAVQLTDRADQR